MVFRYAFDDAVIYMRQIWAKPTSAPVLLLVTGVATVSMLLVGVGML